ncbi:MULTISPECIES: helix-turn-helix domain-containing protein [Bacillus]|uniref:helix-turn-helix domain-containing protein n=1 Tax=Bacillus TaxID=1386 RepID=UPI00039C6688|nr:MULTISPECIES: helix-turn-helix domain-containing protein [Bacillus]AUS14815.1 XRE family transcriptional regulator [Bacillus velezensis]MBN7743846.1 helix-turn-helix domain-containing protein [Bacillus velezensis]MBS0046348.1 helix-turn-helix domain-containing protein [Bacillus velezensis]MBW7978002.1 XRE family transcriptional regulator [Bacillus velezensis]MCE4941057.1 helix-turn-helix domain-containing protein [Bacillus velezensis]
MVDFSPLFKTLEEKEMNLSDLRQVISSRTQTSIKENHMQANLKMYIGTLEKICLFLDVPVEKVIRIVKE